MSDRLLRPGGGIGPAAAGPARLEALAAWLRGLAGALDEDDDKWHGATLRAVWPRWSRAEDVIEIATIMEEMAAAMRRHDLAGSGGR